jgi:NDP-sugar pyrophosphorylase family protein
MNSNGRQITAVILAGGLGTRLKPYTVSFPKPLMPVGDFPILEIVIKQLKAMGVNRVIIAVGYLESLIKAYFGNGSKFGLDIIYSSEDKPMGTAGPLRLIQSQLDQTFIFMNGDVFTDLDFSQIFDSHVRSSSLATIAVARRSVSIDFGVVEFDENFGFSEWNEKPELSYDVSMGIYVLEPEVISHIPKSFYNIPDLILKLKADGEPVRCYEHTGYWLDIGREQDYQQACQDMVDKGIDYWIKNG